MVQERVTDGPRIGTLLAAELAAQRRGPHAELDVVDGHRVSDPGPSGETGFRLVYDDEDVGTARVYPDRVEVAILGVPERTATDRSTLSVHATNGRSIVIVRSGAGTKPAVDVIRDALDA